MSGLHGTLGWLSLVLAVVVTAVAVAAWLVGRRRDVAAMGLVTTLAAIAATATTAAALFLGGLLLITGLRPFDQLHLLYGVASVAVLPIAASVRAWRDHERGRRPAHLLWVAGGGLVLIALTLLLAQTGRP